MRLLPLFPATLLLLTASTPSFALKTPVHHTVRTSAHARPQQHNSLKNAAAHKTVHAAIPQPHHDALTAMPTDRATAIQTALIQRGYLSGQPSGNWDAQTVAAMEKLQSDNGWQTRLTPDARALIKLGLGPNATPPQ